VAALYGLACLVACVIIAISGAIGLAGSFDRGCGADGGGRLVCQ